METIESLEHIVDELSNFLVFQSAYLTQRKAIHVLSILDEFNRNISRKSVEELHTNEEVSLTSTNTIDTLEYLRSKVYYTLGYTHTLLGNYDLARNYIYNSKSYAEAQNDTVGIAQSLAVIAQIDFAQKLYTEAIQHSNEALLHFAFENDPYNEAQSVILICEVYKKQHKLFEAIDYLFTILSNETLMKQGVFAWQILLYSAKIHFEALLFDDSWNHLQLAKEMFIGMKHSYDYSSLLTIEAALYIQKEQYKNAIDLLAESISINIKFGKKDSLIQQYRLKGQCYEILEELDIAAEAFINSIYFANEMKNFEEKVLSQCYMARLELNSNYSGQNSFTGNRLFKESIASINKSNVNQQHCDVILSYCVYLELTEQWQEALTFHKLYHSYYIHTLIKSNTLANFISLIGKQFLKIKS